MVINRPKDFNDAVDYILTYYDEVLAYDHKCKCHRMVRFGDVTLKTRDGEVVPHVGPFVALRLRRSPAAQLDAYFTDKWEVRRLYMECEAPVEVKPLDPVLPPGEKSWWSI